MADFRLSSSAFEHDEDLPARHTAADDDVSPPLSWSAPPEGARELVLVCDDPDAETGVFTHWVVFGIAPDQGGLPEGIPRDALVDDPPLVQGLNDFDELGYSGPLAPEDRGPHRIFFRLFALDIETDLQPGATRAELRKAVQEHVIGRAELVGIA